MVVVKPNPPKSIAEQRAELAARRVELEKITKGSVFTGLLFNILFVSFFAALMFIGSFATSSAERFESIKSYPSRFTFHKLPSDIYSILPESVTAFLEESYQDFDYYFGEEDPRKFEFEDWVEWQEMKAWKGLLANIDMEGTMEGCVVASPSTDNPNYFYQWTRDSALVARTLIQTFVAGRKDLEKIIKEYIEAVEFMQHQETTIGGFHTGGLGDVKYLPIGNPFKGEWSRPQPDGPAARVITLVMFANHLLDFGTADDRSFVTNKLYDGKDVTESIIKGDLEYLGKHWGDAGFDLWEEVSGSHFYTLLSIQKALFAGSALATRLNDYPSATFYEQQAEIVQSVVPKFWSEEKGIIRVSMNFSKGRDSEENAHRDDDTYGKVSELDAAVLLATLHSGDESNWVGSDEILATLGAFMDTMSTVYPMNAKRKIPALGRYPEDQYDGYGLSLANPWFICTLAASEVVYKASSYLNALNEPLIITKNGWKWYNRFLPVGEGAKIAPGSREMGKIVEGMKDLGDGWLRIVQEHVGKNGSMHEQYDRVTGVGRGARDLTWSYAAFITAAEARRGGKPSWGLLPPGGIKWRKMLF